MNCPICIKPLASICLVKCTPYGICTECGTIHTDKEINPETENDKPEDRNIEDVMQERLNRVIEVLSNKPLKCTDFGCGEGQFVKYLDGKGIDIIGVDADFADLSDIPENSEDVIFMIEVVEHLSNPIKTLSDIASKLNTHGVIYIETTFADDINDHGSHTYVDPSIGHRTIISRKGLDICAKAAGLELAKEVNSNVVILKKI